MGEDKSECSELIPNPHELGNTYLDGHLAFSHRLALKNKIGERYLKLG